MPKAGIANVMGEWSERFMSSDRGLFIPLFLHHSMAHRYHTVPKISGNNSVGKPRHFSSMSLVGHCNTAAGFIWGEGKIILIDYSHVAYLPDVQINSIWVLRQDFWGDFLFRDQPRAVRLCSIFWTLRAENFPAFSGCLFQSGTISVLRKFFTYGCSPSDDWLILSLLPDPRAEATPFFLPSQMGNPFPDRQPFWNYKQVDN